jgi:hypothetical protein
MCWPLPTRRVPITSRSLSLRFDHLDRHPIFVCSLPATVPPERGSNLRAPHVPSLYDDSERAGSRATSSAHSLGDWIADVGNALN